MAYQVGLHQDPYQLTVGTVRCAISTLGQVNLPGCYAYSNVQARPHLIRHRPFKLNVSCSCFRLPTHLWLMDGALID